MAHVRDIWSAYFFAASRDDSERSDRNTFRTPDVVEFAVSPQVGQAVLACPPALKWARRSNRIEGRRAPPAPPAKLSPSKGMAQPIFSASQKVY